MSVFLHRENLAHSGPLAHRISEASIQDAILKGLRFRTWSAQEQETFSHRVTKACFGDTVRQWAGDIYTADPRCLKAVHPRGVRGTAPVGPLALVVLQEAKELRRQVLWLRRQRLLHVLGQGLLVVGQWRGC
eukprot:9253135-Karenia_brevis.AAC.1